MKRLVDSHREVLGLAILALTATLSGPAAPAFAAPHEAQPSSERVEKLATLRRQVRALTNLEPRSVDDVVRGLGLLIGPAVQVHEHRKEWPIQPSAALQGGMLMDGGRDMIVELTPSRGLNATFEELAPVLMDLPHFVDALEGHHGEDSLATRVLAINHSFKVHGGHLTVRVATPFPPDTPNQTVLARKEGRATAAGRSTRPAIVQSIFFTPDQSRLWPESMMRTLAERRRQGRGR